MYLHTKIGNGMYVSEIAGLGLCKQHVIENKGGYIIVVKHYTDSGEIQIYSVLTTQDDTDWVNRIRIPEGNYRTLRAALKAFVSIASMYRIRKHVY